MGCALKWSPPGSFCCKTAFDRAGSAAAAHASHAPLALERLLIVLPIGNLEAGQRDAVAHVLSVVDGPLLVVGFAVAVRLARLDGLVDAGGVCPAGVALRVRALHGVLQAVRMVRGLQRCLALRAVVAHGLEGGLVAFAADDLAVLHVHPHAAFHLAAAAARGTNALDLAGRRGAGAGFGQRGAGACDSDRSSGSGSHLRERATRHRELAHASFFLVARLLSRRLLLRFAASRPSRLPPL